MKKSKKKMIYFDKFEKEIDPRINDLLRQNKNIEAFYFLFAAMETELKILIDSYYNLMKFYLKNNGFHYENKYIENLDDKTIGDSIKILKFFYKKGNEEKLIKKIEEFNSYRIIITHKLFNQNITKLNSQLKNKLAEFYKTMHLTVRERIKIYKRYKELHDKLPKNIKRILRKRIKKEKN